MPSGSKIDTKLTIYPEDAPAPPTPAPTGNVQTYLKRVAIVRGYVLSRTDLTLYGLGAVRFTIPAEEQTKGRGFTVAIYDSSKKHRARLLGYDANAALANDVVSAVVAPNPIPLKKGTGYSLLLYGDELAPTPAPNTGAYPAPGNNPFVTPVPGASYGSAAPYPVQTYNPYAPPTPYNPYATPTPYNPYATPTPYGPH